MNQRPLEHPIPEEDLADLAATWDQMAAIPYDGTPETDAEKRKRLAVLGEDVPYLIREIRRLQAENAALTDENQALVDVVSDLRVQIEASANSGPLGAGGVEANEDGDSGIFR